MHKSLKVIHACPLFYPSIGGNQVHVQKLSERLALAGDDVHVMTAQALDRVHFAVRDPAQNKPAQQEVMNGLTVHRFPINYLISDTMLTKSRRVRGGGRLMKLLFGEALGYWRNGPCVKGMLRGIREVKPDIIMGVMDNAFTTYICYMARKKFDIPFVFMPITHVIEHGPHHTFLPKIYAMADRIIACTDFEKHILIERGVAPDKITVLPIGIASEELDGHDARRVRKKYGLKEAPTVAYIGRIVQGKGVDTLINAMKVVWQHNPNTQLLLAGRTNNQYESRFRDKLRSLNEHEQAKTVYVGGFDEEDKKDLFAAADIMAMVSSVDCFGLVYLESWLCGVPVIAAKDSPQSCIVDDGENGLLVKYDDVGELARAILKLLDNPEMSQKYGQNGHQKVDKCFQIDQYARNLHNVYEEVLSQ